MKATELRDMTDVELNKQLKDLKAELFNLRFQHAINQLDNPKRIDTVKKDIDTDLAFAAFVPDFRLLTAKARAARARWRSSWRSPGRRRAPHPACFGCCPPR